MYRILFCHRWQNSLYVYIYIYIYRVLSKIQRKVLHPDSWLISSIHTLDDMFLYRSTNAMLYPNVASNCKLALGQVVNHLSPLIYVHMDDVYISIWIRYWSSSICSLHQTRCFIDKPARKARHWTAWMGQALVDDLTGINKHVWVKLLSLTAGASQLPRCRYLYCLFFWNDFNWYTLMLGSFDGVKKKKVYAYLDPFVWRWPRLLSMGCWESLKTHFLCFCAS
jgi:hypothetical protein